MSNQNIVHKITVISHAELNAELKYWTIIVYKSREKKRHSVLKSIYYLEENWNINLKCIKLGMQGKISVVITKRIQME